jgi:hypothetical protein
VTLLKWGGALGVVALIAYGVSQMSSIAYDERDIAVVDFSDLTAGQKRAALEAANRARCACGCGLTLAQCVATDSTCPIRESNIDRIRRMVAEAVGARQTP